MIHLFKFIFRFKFFKMKGVEVSPYCCSLLFSVLNNLAVRRDMVFISSDTLSHAATKCWKLDGRV